ncbi:hypothetical protein ATO13_22271 [Stappia sp. 22II-S9-Z10]|nr:hypothetical protein ATO13_22271 [Stappia sp. 22II-S9-Z10]
MNDANPVYSNEVDGDWGEGFSSDIDALREYCEDYDIAVPAYVHPCTPQRFSIDSDHIVESALEDFHEDAGDQILEEDDLHSFIRTWNAKQTLTTWFPDISCVVVLDEDRFAALLDHPHERGQAAAAGDDP